MRIKKSPADYGDRSATYFYSFSLLKNRGNRAFHLGETEFVLKKLEGIGLHFIVCTSYMHGWILLNPKASHQA